MLNSSLVNIEIGDLVLYNKRRTVKIVDFKIMPNGANDPKLVVIIYAKDSEGTVSATSDKFEALEEQVYKEFYPTPHMFSL